MDSYECASQDWCLLRHVALGRRGRAQLGNAPAVHPVQLCRVRSIPSLSCISAESYRAAIAVMQGLKTAGMAMSAWCPSWSVTHRLASCNSSTRCSSHTGTTPRPFSSSVQTFAIGTSRHYCYPTSSRHDRGNGSSADTQGGNGSLARPTTQMRLILPTPCRLSPPSQIL